MSTITRRTALAGGTAAIATAALSPPIPAQADDELFAAIARWRSLRDAYEAERDRQAAVCAQVDAEMPDFCKARDAFCKVLWATNYQDRTPKQLQQLEDMNEAMSPLERAYAARIRQLGYDEDITGDMSASCGDACEAAFEVPAHTLVGLQVKVEMLLIEWPDDTRYEGSEYVLPSRSWGALVADIGRLAGEVQS